MIFFLSGLHRPFYEWKQFMSKLDNRQMKEIMTDPKKVSPSKDIVFQWLWKFVRGWQTPWIAILISFTIYSLIAFKHGNWGEVSRYPYFNYLADSFLHGQFYLRQIPIDTHDLVFFGGKYFLYWPPFPAILLMPFVAIWGVSFSDVIFTLVLGSANVGLMALFIKQANQKRILNLKPEQQGMLVLFFALGTVYLTLVPVANVWYTSQIVSFTFVLLAYLAAIALKGWKAFLCAGLAMAAAIATRNHLVLAGLWPAYYLLSSHWSQRWRRLILNSIIGLLPAIVMVSLLAYYNYSRFGSIFDLGISSHQMAPLFRADYQEYGYLSVHYVPINFYYQMIFYPFPIRERTFMGGSLFLLSPVFFGIFWSFRNKSQLHNVLVLSITAVLVYIPILLLMGTGWIQFGPRYTLDFTVPLLLLTGIGIEKWKNKSLAILTYLSFIQYLAGVLILILVM
jgi:hypothetical protein